MLEQSIKRQINANSLFLNESDESWRNYQRGTEAVMQVLRTCYCSAQQPFSGISIQELQSQLREQQACPREGQSLHELMEHVRQLIVKHSVVVHHPKCAAHLHCPPLIPSLLAEMLISATNQSMDSWDQSPSATMLEQKVIAWLCQLFGYTAQGDGVFTSGGTQSNFMGLLLARDQCINKAWNWNVQKYGLPPQARYLRILCSEAAHFTVRQSAALLGLGEQAVVQIKTDEQYRMCAADLQQTIDRVKEQGGVPMAIVATAGTTDFGSIDPLVPIARAAQNHGIWLHVDAAYGGAVKLSERYQYLIEGIEYADSITVDFHKMFYQSISCGAFLLRDQSQFQYMRLHADYLNPEEDDDKGIPNLVSKSIQTTRRFDALKLYLSLQLLGREHLALLVESTLELARQAAAAIDSDSQLELLHQPELNAVVFRYTPSSHPEEVNYKTWQNKINHEIPNELIQRGMAIMAQTKVEGRDSLKFTLLNPRTAVQDVIEMLAYVKMVGAELELRFSSKK